MSILANFKYGKPEHSDLGETLKKLAILLALVAISIVLSTPVAAQDIEAEAWISLDKTPYEPGQQGKIFITVRNVGDDPIEVKNLTVEFSQWMRYTDEGWDPLGNETVIYDPVVIIPSKEGVALDAITFTVPDDDRAHSTLVDLAIYTNKGRLPSHSIMGWNDRIDVMDPFNLRYLRAMDNIVTVLTILAILAIVSAIVVAAAIFLQGRRSGVTWAKEE